MKENQLHVHLSLKEIFKKLSESLDRVIYNYFFKKYSPRLLRFALLFKKQYGVTEESGTDVMLNILKKRKKIPTTDKNERVIFISVKNKSFKYNRKSFDQVFTNNFQSFADLLRSPFVSQENEYLENEFPQVVKSTIDALPPIRKLIFNTVREDGLKYHKVANLFDFFVWAIDTQIGLTLKSLKENIEQYKYMNLRASQII